MVTKDELRYEREMKQFNETGFFTNKDGVCSSTLKPKPKKIKIGQMIKVVQEVKPKKPMVPFMFAMKELATVVMKEKGLKSCAQAAPIVSQRFKEMSETQKQKYIDLSIKDQARHLKQTEELQEKGYFTLEDGALSTSLKPKIKKILGKRTRAVKVVAQNDLQEQENEESSQDEAASEESESEEEVQPPPKKRARKN